MAQKIQFAGRTISIPGAYSQILSGIQNQSLALGAGNVLVIDTGSGRFFGGGSGISGVLKSGKDALYTFDNVIDFRKFIRGGLWWLLSSPLFSPSGGAQNGVDSITYVRAAATIPAQISFTFGSGDSQISDDGSIVLYVKKEGFVGNGVLGDETRAKSTITITGAGVAGNSVSISIAGVLVGTYTIVAGDTIATVVTGLAAAIAALGYCDIFATNATTLTILAPHGEAATLNTTSPTISVIGATTATTTAFVGGAEGTILTRGYAGIMVPGVVDATKYIFKFYRGTFKGLDTAISTGDPYDFTPELSCAPELISTSPEVNTVNALYTWMKGDAGFNEFFTIASDAIGTTDAITASDYNNYKTYLKAVGGSEVFNSTYLQNVLDAVAGQVYDFILSDNWGTNVLSANNSLITAWVNATAKIKPDIIFGGGKDSTKWNSGGTSSVAVAQGLNLQQNILVHSGAYQTAPNGTLKPYDSIYHAACVLGRIAGLAPQVPATFKNIGIKGVIHQLLDKDLTLGLDAGVLMVRADGTSFEVVEDVNTLQNNTFLVNPDGTTANIALGRIERQLNKELVASAKIDLFKNPNGTNRNTLSVEDVVTWTQNFLQSKVSTDQVDNLILSYQAVSAVLNGTVYNIYYAFVPNSEITALFFTGTIVNG